VCLRLRLVCALTHLLVHLGPGGSPVNGQEEELPRPDSLKYSRHISSHIGEHLSLGLGLGPRLGVRARVNDSVHINIQVVKLGEREVGCIGVGEAAVDWDWGVLDVLGMLLKNV